MRILVAVIAYNEADSIKATLEDLNEFGGEYDIVVIDNASTDRSVDIYSEAGVTALCHCVNTGGSFGTVMTYFRYAHMYGYDIVCQFDGDGQHIASELSTIIQPIADDQADYVIGSRFLKKEGFQSYFLRRLGIRLFALLDSIIIGQRVTDVTSGFRAYGRKVIELFAKNYRHEIEDTNQLLLLSHYAGARIKEVPIEMKARSHGTSEYNMFHSLSYPLKGLISIVGCLLQKKQHLLR